MRPSSEHLSTTCRLPPCLASSHATCKFSSLPPTCFVSLAYFHHTATDLHYVSKRIQCMHCNHTPKKPYRTSKMCAVLKSKVCTLQACGLPRKYARIATMHDTDSATDAVIATPMLVQNHLVLSQLLSRSVHSCSSSRMDHQKVAVHC